MEYHGSGHFTVKDKVRIAWYMSLNHSSLNIVAGRFYEAAIGTGAYNCSCDILHLLQRLCRGRFCVRCDEFSDGYGQHVRSVADNLANGYGSSRDSQEAVAVR